MFHLYGTHAQIYSPSSNMFCLVEFNAFQQADALLLTLHGEELFERKFLVRECTVRNSAPLI